MPSFHSPFFRSKPISAHFIPLLHALFSSQAPEGSESRFARGEDERVVPGAFEREQAQAKELLKVVLKDGEDVSFAMEANGRSGCTEGNEVNEVSYLFKTARAPIHFRA